MLQKKALVNYTVCKGWPLHTVYLGKGEHRIEYIKLTALT